MQLKKRIRIGPCTYRPKYDPNLLEEYDLYGASHHRSKQELTVCANMPEDRQAIAFLHESLHAMNTMYELNLSEGQTRTAATAVTALLRDNPELADLLCGRERGRRK